MRLRTASESGLKVRRHSLGHSCVPAASLPARSVAGPTGRFGAHRFFGEALGTIAPNPFGVREITIPGGRCAMLRHAGSTDHINETIHPFYRDWLPQRSEQLAEHPLFFHYLSAYPETPMDQWQTAIYIPLV